MKIETVRRILHTRCKGRIVREIAQEIGVSRGFIFHVIAGRKQPGPKVLNYLGLECHEVYRRRRSAPSFKP
jgi:hypothetical protein